jgi:hypothetical protein
VQEKYEMLKESITKVKGGGSTRDHPSIIEVHLIFFLLLTVLEMLFIYLFISIWLI